MDPSRIEFLRQALKNNPEDTFARYALALELAKYGDPREAWEHFDHLLTYHPDYSPTYYHAGMFLISQDRREEARRVLSQGIEVTGRLGNPHAQSELQAALDQLSGPPRL